MIYKTKSRRFEWLDGSSLCGLGSLVGCLSDWDAPAVIRGRQRGVSIGRRGQGGLLTRFGNFAEFCKGLVWGILCLGVGNGAGPVKIGE